MMLDELSIVHGFEEDHITETCVTDDRDDFADGSERPTRSVTSAPTGPPPLTRAGGDTVNRSILNCATPHPIEGILCDLTWFLERSFPTMSFLITPRNGGSSPNCRDNIPWFSSSAAEGIAPKTDGSTKPRAIPRGEGKSTGARPQRLTRIRAAREGIR
jgi:hypothetical protein